MKGFFDSIPKELEEAGVIDGCGVFGAFARIVLPLTRPGLAATTAYAFVLAWSDYLFAKTFLQDRSEEHTSELQSRGHLVCRLLLEKKTALMPAVPRPNL